MCELLLTRRWWVVYCSVFAIVSSALRSPAVAADEAEAEVDFKRDIQPILVSKCLRCHGAVKRKSGLSLLYRRDALMPNESGKAAIVPGQPEKSELFRRVSAGDPDDRMPPSGKPLGSEQIEALRRWIAAGAPYARHWAFVKPQDHALPRVEQEPWPRSGIDHFVLARLEKEGLEPAAEADRYTLIRRLSLDLTGLPPTPGEIERFVRDTSPEAYENVVDGLLASGHYGERWAAVWLDMARYADTQGYEKDNRRTIWRYRDWVIDAFNKDTPFDQFTIEQLAGDLLAHPTIDQLIATAFHRNTMTNTEGGTDDEEFRVAALVDRVNTTWQVWMGTTFGCAQCHNHPYDGYTQKEYYRFFAFLNNTEDSDKPDERPTIPTPMRRQQKEIERLQTEIAALRTQIGDTEGAKKEDAKKEADDLRQRLAKLEEQLKAIKPLTTPILRELPPEKRRKTHILIRGSFLTKGDAVEPGIPGSLNPMVEGTPRNRLSMARWLVDEANPLTARVTVNRFWEHLFGSGFVETSEDFGTQGSLPSHPKLLDWLAVRFTREYQWSVKRLLKEIVMSATYRQSSGSTPELMRRDPRSRLLARGPRFRLEAEMIRDQALAVSGLLSRKMLGPSVMPPQPSGIWQVVYSSDKWVTGKDDDRYRRALYTFWRRTSPYPSMITFDGTSREFCMVRRIRTNTPLQALVTLNDPVYIEAAQALARRIMLETDADLEQRAAYGFRLCVARPPRPEEARRLVALYRSELEAYRKDADAARHMATTPLGPAPEGVDLAELAAWTLVSNVLLNLDEFLTKG